MPRGRMRAAPEPRQAAHRLTAGLLLVAGCVLLFFGIAVRLLSEKLVLGRLFRVLKGKRSAAAARGVLGCARGARGLCAVPVHGKGSREHCWGMAERCAAMRSQVNNQHGIQKALG